MARASVELDPALSPQQMAHIGTLNPTA